MTPTPAHVLILTGGLITAHEPSLLNVLNKLLVQGACTRHGWLEFVVKSLVAEPLLAMQLERLFNPRFMRSLPPDLRHALATRNPVSPPSLTQVLLATLLEQQGISWETLAMNDLFASRRRSEEALGRAGCVFLSSTYLHDFSELDPVLRRIKRPHARIVLGGALAATLPAGWEGHPDIDVVAIGYGELMIGQLANWLRSGFTELQPPPCGRIEKRCHSIFLYSGVPETRSLDELPRPDWRLAGKAGGAPETIYYESVRGCPYRCSFCNYPYLFDDHVFRCRSARRMADDWEYYVKELGVRTIICLDSLFTMPRTRLHEFCTLLTKRRIQVNWTCYARANDLADEATVHMMKAAGAHQVHVGIESGDPLLLHNMNKACTVETNHAALINSRRYGLTTIATFIVGFPGETVETMERTYDFICAAPPDFHFLIPFSTRVAGVPLLNTENRQRFGMRVVQNLYTLAPYWKHDTMCCSDVGRLARKLEQQLTQNRISLNCAVFFGILPDWKSEWRETCLTLQKRAAAGHPLLKHGFDLLHAGFRHKIRRDVFRMLDSATGT